MATPVLMFMNMKGGVGKTTLAVEISRTLAYYYDKDVLLVDYDPQANASFAFLENTPYFKLLADGRSIASCLMPNVDANDPFDVVGAVPRQAVDVSSFTTSVRGWHYPNNPSRKAGSLSLIPGNLDLMRLALNVHSSPFEKRLLARWNGLLASAKKSFDCVIVDCHPAGSFFTKSALLASDVVIIPVTTDGYAALGLGMMRQLMEMWEPSGGAKEWRVIFNDAHHAWDEQIETTIRNDSRWGDNCLSVAVKYSALLRNLAKRRQTSSEQPVAHRRRVGNNIYTVTAELVKSLQQRNIFDSSWG